MCTSFHEKPTFLCELRKNIKFDAEIGIFYKILFFHTAWKMSFFRETICAHIEYEDIHAVVSELFSHFKIFFGEGHICTQLGSKVIFQSKWANLKILFLKSLLSLEHKYVVKPRKETISQKVKKNIVCTWWSIFHLQDTLSNNKNQEHT